jgi:MFS transporter, CP family, cyanate transporter
VPRNREQILILIGLVALSFNLRPAASSVGPVIHALNDDLGMSATTAGFLTTLPVLCFAVFGALAPWFARVIGAHRVMLIALGLSSLGLWARSVVDNSWLFLLVTVLPLAGMATANVLLPSLIKRHFPTRIGLLTAIYSTTLAIGMTLSSALTVPIGEAAGSWRYGIAMWGLTAFVATLPWLGLLQHDVHPDAGLRRSIGFRDVARTRLARMMALYFGCQSMHAYAIFGWMPEIYGDAGFSASTAGLLLALTQAVGIPVSFVLPGLVARRRDQTPIMAVLTACYLAGYLGLLLWPSQGAVAWCVLIGLGTGAFPLVLTLLGLRASTPDGTAALSSFTQSTGYLIAGVAPFLMGFLYDTTGSWTAPILMLILLLAPLLWSGLQVARPQYVEDELTTPAKAAP